MKTLLAVAALLLVTGCSSADDSDGAGGSPAPGAQSPPTLAVPSAPAEADPEVADSEACGEVVEGIDAFNRGDYDETVEHFEAAVPLAEAQDDGSDAADELVEAVRYYAELAADDYLEASRTSPDFQTYKAITLSQCASGDQLEPPGGEASGIPA